MASPYVVDITNGVGTSAILNGSYAVTSAVPGYHNASLLPSSQLVSAGVNTYAFTIAATGTLTLRVTEDGTEEGTPVVGAAFVRCDPSGNVYGNAVLSDQNGDAVFHYVPYAAADAPLIYYKQTASDGAHEFLNTLRNTSMTADTKTVVIENAPPALRTLNLTDPNYTGLPIAAGTLTLS